MPTNLKTFFMYLAISDLVVGLLAQPMLGLIGAVMSKKVANGNATADFNYLCPKILNVGHFSYFFLTCASFFTISATSVDRLLAVTLHLRYQELVTFKRVTKSLVCKGIVSYVAASLFICLPNNNRIVAVVVEMIGLLFTTVAYLYVFKVVRYHRNQIHNQVGRSNAQAVEMIR